MFRKAVASDCEAVYHLICELEKEVFPFDKFSNIYFDQLENSSYYCIVYEAHNKVGGILNLRFESQLHHADKVAEILEFVIDPSLRNQGIGKQMLDHAFELSKKAGCCVIEVDCNQKRKDTHRFYLRHGMNNSHFKFTKANASR